MVIDDERKGRRRLVVRRIQVEGDAGVAAGFPLHHPVDEPIEKMTAPLGERQVGRNLARLQAAEASVIMLSVSGTCASSSSAASIASRLRSPVAPEASR